MNQGILNTLWDWIHGKNHIVRCICFELENKIVGIAKKIYNKIANNTGFELYELKGD